MFVIFTFSQTMGLLMPVRFNWLQRSSTSSCGCFTPACCTRNLSIGCFVGDFFLFPKNIFSWSLSWKGNAEGRSNSWNECFECLAKATSWLLPAAWFLPACFLPPSPPFFHSFPPYPSPLHSLTLEVSLRWLVLQMLANTCCLLLFPSAGIATKKAMTIFRLFLWKSRMGQNKKIRQKQ